MLNGKHLQTVKGLSNKRRFLNVKQQNGSVPQKQIFKNISRWFGLQFLPNKMLNLAEFKSELQVVGNTKCRINYIFRWGARWE